MVSLTVYETWDEFKLLCAINLPKEDTKRRSFCGIYPIRRAIEKWIMCDKKTCPRLKQRYKSEKLRLVPKKEEVS